MDAGVVVAACCECFRLSWGGAVSAPYDENGRFVHHTLAAGVISEIFGADIYSFVVGKNHRETKKRRLCCTFYPHTPTMGDKLYKAFTGNGVLTSRWEAAGMGVTFSSEKQCLSFELPEGWEDTMTPDLSNLREVEWGKIDDPTLGVRYTLRVVTTHDGKEVNVKLSLYEYEDDTIELRTGTDFEPLRLIPPGTTVSIEIIAHAKIVKQTDSQVVLIRGEMTVPLETRWLSENTPGLLFILGGGFALSVHVLEENLTKTITHLSILGRAENLGLL